MKTDTSGMRKEGRRSRPKLVSEMSMNLGRERGGAAARGEPRSWCKRVQHTLAPQLALDTLVALLSPSAPWRKASCLGHAQCKSQLFFPHPPFRASSAQGQLYRREERLACLWALSWSLGRKHLLENITQASELVAFTVIKSAFTAGLVHLKWIHSAPW